MPNTAQITAALLQAAKDWLDSCRDSEGQVNPGTTSTGMILTGHLIRFFPLKPEDVASKSQVKGVGGPQAKKLLASFDEHRKFLSEAGRTSRENRDRGLVLAERYNASIAGSDFAILAADERETVVRSVQAWFVERLQEEFFAKERIKAEIIISAPASTSVRSLIQAGIDRGGNVGGAVAQHLVGAKLMLRFPEEEIGNDSYTTADQQTARQGDFTVGDTAFHVTMRPTPQLMDGRCKSNLSHGFRPVVLVPTRLVAAANSLAEMADIDGRVSVLGIEEFVGLNIEEMAAFTALGVRTGLRRLLETYNERVENAETDPSLLIEIPENL